ncbi:MAG: DUF1015 domain-containing protein [bacterium]
MVELKPFRGIRYDTQRVGDLSRLVCPPYDVIPPHEQEFYHSLHPCNAVRLDFGLSRPEDSQDDNRYTRAAGWLSTWLSQGVLIREEHPGFYLLEEQFRNQEGAAVTRHGLIGLLRLEEDRPGGSVRLHEFTHSGPKRDRLELMKATGANLSQIFVLYEDDSRMLEGLLRDASALAARGRAEGRDEVRRRLYFVSRPGLLRQIEQFFRQKSLFVADGHHRYETALAYRAWVRARAESGRAAFEAGDYLMVYLTNSMSPGLCVYPTHRILSGYPGWDPEAFLRAAGDFFEIEPGGPRDEPVSRSQAFRRLKESAHGPARIAFFSKGLDNGYLLSLSDPERAASLFPPTTHPLMRSLDVTILHELLLGRILGMSRDAQDKGESLIYVKGEEAALAALDQGASHQAAFLLGPPAVRTIMELSGLGIRMPQKTTYFYPKLLTGLVFRKMEEGSP